MLSFILWFLQSAMVGIPFFVIPSIHFNRNPKAAMTAKQTSRSFTLSTSSNRSSHGELDQLFDAPQASAVPPPGEVLTRTSSWTSDLLSSVWNNSVMWKIRCYYTAPVTKFYLRMVNNIKTYTIQIYWWIDIFGKIWSSL